MANKLLSMLAGAARAYNQMSEEERKAAADAKAAAEKRAADIETYRAKKEIDVEFEKPKEGALTQEQFQTYQAEYGQKYRDMGYGIFAMPQGGGYVKPELKKIEQADQTFGTMADVQNFMDTTSKTFQEGGLGVPEFSIETVEGGRFKAKAKTPTKKEGEVTGTIYTKFEDADAQRSQMQAAIDADPKRKGKSKVMIDRNAKGLYTLDEVKLDVKEEKPGPGVDQYGLEYNFDYPYLASGLYTGVKELDSRRNTSTLAPLKNTRLPVQGPGLADIRYGDDYDIIFTDGVGTDKYAQLNDFAHKFKTHMTPDFVRKYAIADRQEGGRASRGINEIASAMETFFNLYNSREQDVAGDDLVHKSGPIHKAHPWLLEYAKIDHPAIQRVLKSRLQPMPDADNPLAQVMPINEPAYTDGDETKTPINMNLASAFAKEVEDPVTKQVRRVYDKEFTNATLKVAQASGVQQGKFHKLLNSTGSPERARQAWELHVAAQDVLKDEEFIGVDPRRGTASFFLPQPTAQDRSTILAAVNMVEDPTDRITMMESLIPAKFALASVTAHSKNNTPSGRFSTITGKDEKSFRDLTDQLQITEDVLQNSKEMTKLLLEGAPVGAPLTLERLKNGASYVLKSLSSIQTKEGSSLTGADVLKDLSTKFEAAKSEGDIDAQRAAMVNLLGTMLSYQLARMMDPNGRLSDEDRRTVEGAMGFQGIFANPDAALAVLGSMQERAAYIQARNTALTTGDTKRQLAAHAYDRYSGGGDKFSMIYTSIFPVDKESTGTVGGTTGDSLYGDEEFSTSQSTQQSTSSPAPVSVPISQKKQL